MFQGIVEQKGKILSHFGRSLTIAPTRPWSAKDGDSVAVNGVCLTVCGRAKKTLTFDLGEETLKITSLQFLKAGEWVNLEKPVKLGSPIHGHIISGHVEGTATVVKIAPLMQVQLKGNWNYVWKKGSLALDGVSLTINEVKKNKDGQLLDFCLIPETLRRTNLGFKKPGDLVNIETDYLAKLLGGLTRREAYA